jgi:hypothetical protein
MGPLITAPFPHVVADGFITAETLRIVNAEWPTEGWKDHHHAHSAKRGNPSWEQFGATAYGLLKMLNCGPLLDSLKELFGMPDLSADGSLAGGGLHETLCGGFLDIHADFNKHPDTGLYRRANLLLFLNPEWQWEWGGHLELWDREKTGCQVKIAPVGGRCVIFETAPDSFHGHPSKLACPPGVSRRSIALYYYSTEPGRQIAKEHSTLYLGEEAEWPKIA